MDKPRLPEGKSCQTMHDRSKNDCSVSECTWKAKYIELAKRFNECNKERLRWLERADETSVGDDLVKDFGSKFEDVDVPEWD